MLKQPVALTAVSVGAHFHAHSTRVLTEPRSQPGKAGESLECTTQPGSALSRLCLPNLGALPLLLVRNRLQGREPGPWGLYSLYSLEGPLPGTPAQGPHWRKAIRSPLLPACIPIAPGQLALLALAKP